MGTRSTLRIKDIKRTLVTIYRQYDGYPTGMGQDIKDILNGGYFLTLVNGFSGSDRHPEKFNGMGDFAAYMVMRLKFNNFGQTIGNVYITDNKDFQEYNYTLYNKVDDNNIYLKIQDYNKKVMYNGLLKNADMAKIEEVNND